MAERFQHTTCAAQHCLPPTPAVVPASNEGIFALKALKPSCGSLPTPPCIWTQPFVSIVHIKCAHRLVLTGCCNTRRIRAGFCQSGMHVAPNGHNADNVASLCTALRAEVMAAALASKGEGCREAATVCHARLPPWPLRRPAAECDQCACCASIIFRTADSFGRADGIKFEQTLDGLSAVPVYMSYKCMRWD